VTGSPDVPFVQARITYLTTTKASISTWVPAESAALVPSTHTLRVCVTAESSPVLATRRILGISSGTCCYG
jgi:hypothetical protein